ncbi:MAG: AAA family ATPase [Cyanobacteriota bacterium]|nr:AAA family ATPase [Cyanobacteriota bacterium]
MIREVLIENYKSIQKLKLDLGRINIFIGENGCGKTNILEAIALAAAAASNKLDNEFLVSRGIRVTEPQFMRSAFDSENSLQDIKIQVNGGEEIKDYFKCVLENDNAPYSNWTFHNTFKLSPKLHELAEWLSSQSKKQNGISLEEAISVTEKSSLTQDDFNKRL